MLREMKIEEKLDALMRWMAAVHEKLNLHEWVQDFRPWNAAEQQHKRGAQECNADCRHEVYYVECACGSSRPATRAEFDAATPAFNGY